MALIAREIEKGSYTLSYDGRSGSRSYIVVDADMGSWTKNDAIVASGIPALGEAWDEYRPTLVCTSISAEPVSDAIRYAYIVTAEYETSTYDYDGNPLAEPDRVSIDSYSWEEEYYEDTQSTKAKLTNGLMMDPLPTRERVGYKLIIERNVAPNYTGFAAYVNRVNSDSCSPGGYSFSAYQGRVTSVKLSDIQERSDIQYRTMTIEVTVRQDGWRQTFESRSNRQLVSGSLVPIVAPDGREIDYPYPLTSDGAAAASPSTAPALITLRPYEEVDMSSFLGGT